MPNTSKAHVAACADAKGVATGHCGHRPPIQCRARCRFTELPFSLRQWTNWLQLIETTPLQRKDRKDLRRQLWKQVGSAQAIVGEPRLGMITTKRRSLASWPELLAAHPSEVSVPRL